MTFLTRTVSILLAAQFTLASARVQAAPSSDGADSAKITYDTSDLGNTFDAFGPEITEAIESLLREAGHREVRVRVYWKNIDEFHYGISVALRPGIAIEDAPEVAKCRDCSSAQLEEAIVLGVETAIAQAKLQRAAVEPESPPAVEAVEVAEPEPEPEPSSATEREPLGPLGKGGVAALAVGLPALASGIALVVVKETRPLDDKSQFRDLRPTGYSLLAVGGVSIAAGVVLLVLDRKRAKRPDTASRLMPILGLRAIGLRGSF